MKMAFHKI